MHLRRSEDTDQIKNSINQRVGAKHQDQGPEGDTGPDEGDRADDHAQQAAKQKRPPLPEPVEQAYLFPFLLDEVFFLEPSGGNLRSSPATRNLREFEELISKSLLYKLCRESTFGHHAASFPRQLDDLRERSARMKGRNPSVGNENPGRPAPQRPWALRMRWRELLFAHWETDASVIAALLPLGLELDLFDGRCYVGAVPFLMVGVTPRILPPVPGLHAFPEINLRTYVTAGGKPGVWFFSLDAGQKLAVRTARRLFHLPYFDAQIRDPRDRRRNTVLGDAHASQIARRGIQSLLPGR